MTNNNTENNTPWFRDSPATQEPRFQRDSSQGNGLETPWFRDYDIRIIKDSPHTPYGIYISSEFSNPNDPNCLYEGMFFHEEENLISIELNTKDESLIAEAVSICKAIAENFCMLDDLLRTF